MTRNGLMKLNKNSLIETIMELQDQVNALINVKDKYYEENLIISQEILNLQEENEQLRTQMNTYKNAKDKATEYVNNTIFWGVYEDIPMINTKYGEDLSNILQGG